MESKIIVSRVPNNLLPTVRFSQITERGGCRDGVGGGEKGREEGLI